MPNLNWIKDNTALFEGLPPTPTKEQSKENDGLNFGQFVQVHISGGNCNWILKSRQYAQYFLEPYLNKLIQIRIFLYQQSAAELRQIDFVWHSYQRNG